MQVPETPNRLDDLDLMKLLDAYARRAASFYIDGAPVGASMANACRVLHDNIVQLVEKVLAALLDRVTTREMETFTLHDHVHGLKVAHLMWHILEPQRRQRLTPCEIGLLVLSAHLHDLGMGLSATDREARLAPGSDLWERLEIDPTIKGAIDELRRRLVDPDVPEETKRVIQRRLFQAEEALLSSDTRERHATLARYHELFAQLSAFAQSDPTRIPAVDACLSFNGDSFKEELIDICVSHNQDADTLVEPHPKNPSRRRFPSEFPAGGTTADLHLVAAALRLADILDFDRERTPAVLFHYLLPTSLSPQENCSVLEWSKHLAISSWYIDSDALAFRGRCTSHIIHHAVVQFCTAIQEEISATRATFGALGEGSWPFKLPTVVRAEIYEEGYRYVPYRFELDDERVYRLLMGGAIYPDPIVAIRELLQNAVDACQLRDALTQLQDTYIKPGVEDRIVVRLEEPTNQAPRLVVQDTGTGMDGWVLERWFLKVGRSYYQSEEFSRVRVELRKAVLDFAPVSQFGIGFLSCFLLADRVQVETAMWEPIRGDGKKRTLVIDGPTRLIRLVEERNEGVGRFKGTVVTLFLSGSRPGTAGLLTWERLKEYLGTVCEELPYVVRLEGLKGNALTVDRITPKPLRADVPTHVEDLALRINVSDEAVGIEGEIALVNPLKGEAREKEMAQASAVVLRNEISESRVGSHVGEVSSLIRGGFNVGRVPGLPTSYAISVVAAAKLRLTWRGRPDRRYLLPNLPRGTVAEHENLRLHVFRLWLSYLLERVDSLPEGQIARLYTPRRIDWKNCGWLERYDGLRIYRLAREGWKWRLKEGETRIQAWERGEGGALFFGGAVSGLTADLLNLVLPRVTTVEMDREADLYARPPTPGWRELLAECHNYIRDLITWPIFLDFRAEIGDLLFWQYAGHGNFNAAFRDRFAGWSEEKLRRLSKILNDVAATAQRRQLVLSKDDADLFRRAVEVAGGLQIGSTWGRWRVDALWRESM